MADAANKYSENVVGKLFVDNQCIDCDLCRETAPDNFKRNDDGGYSYVYKQAESPEEEARCKENLTARRRPGDPGACGPMADASFSSET